MKTELRSFLGLCNVYSLFVKNFEMKAHSLNDLLKKGASDKFELKVDKSKAFRTFIYAVCPRQVLALPKPGITYSVDTDSSE